MSALTRSAQDYLEMRRSVGYVLRQPVEAGTG